MCLRLAHRVYLLRVMAETQPKPGNLYSPGTSGKKSVHERDKMKKAKIKNTPPPKKKNQRRTRTVKCHGSQRSSRSAEDLGREAPEEDSLDLDPEFQRGIILKKKMGMEYLKGRAALADMSIPSLQTALSIIPVHGRMLCVEQGLKCKFIKMK